MLKIHPTYLPLLRKQGLDDLRVLFDRFVPETLPGRGEVSVRQDSIPGDGSESVDVFFKLYFFRRPSWRYWGRASKASLEFRNYGIFKQLGIACAEPMACGEQRDALGRLRRAFILTRTVPAAVTLEEFMRARIARPRGPGEPKHHRRMLIEVAKAARRLHARGFFHHDLVWRNILVSPADPEAGRTYWIDCPRGSYVRWRIRRHRALLRDLASFDKSAARQCSRTDRLRAFLRYMGQPRLDAHAKSLLRQVQKYRRARWPDDWLA